MSHYLALVVIPADGDAEDHIERLLDPHREDYDEATDEMVGFWDWWVIGGRWTGHLSEYQPQEDPENWETCFLCHGTGKRDDALGREHRRLRPDYTCNGCGGKGWAVKWPTDFVKHEGDLRRLGDVLPLREEHQPYTLVLPDGAVYHRQHWDGKDYAETPVDYSMLSALDPDLRVVVVDYHC